MRVFQAQTDVLARENEENEEAARCAQEEEDKRYRRRFKIETEVKEEVKDERERRRAAMRSETAKPQATKAGKKLSDHEQKVWKVIQQRAKGLQYCRELDKADAKPPRTGVWKECAGTYTAAYRLGDPWRHRIQNEKSKTKRKAALAGLAELASE